MSKPVLTLRPRQRPTIWEGVSSAHASEHEVAEVPVVSNTHVKVSTSHVYWSSGGGFSVHVASQLAWVSPSPASVITHCPELLSQMYPGTQPSCM